MITVVSGLPRSGTSLTMQMLAAGGLPPLTDGIRQPDEDNPRGYYEYEPVKSLRTDASWMPLAEGKAVKIVHVLLTALPAGFDYRIILMHRHPQAVLASQRKMLERNGKPLAPIPPERMIAAYATQMESVGSWVRAQPNMQILDVQFESLFKDAPAVVGAISSFCGVGLAVEKMLTAIDPVLYRNRD
ncbi:MAG: sulfotransferase [Bryobacterales bacterium]|nr:sulfotransferase [Bryobacterales bacterium]